MNKIIDSILDNYYTRKLIDEIKWCFINYNLDYRIIYYKGIVEIEAKQEKYNDRYYKSIICIHKSESLKHMIDLTKTKEYINKIIILELENGNK